MTIITALERYCLNNGPGLSRVYLEDLKELLKVNGIEERKLKTGVSYFPKGSGKNGRILKIAEVSNRLFIEFNINFTADNSHAILHLSNADCKQLHAGGVKFCYIGDQYDEAVALIEKAICNLYVYDR